MTEKLSDTPNYNLRRIFFSFSLPVFVVNLSNKKKTISCAAVQQEKIMYIKIFSFITSLTYKNLSLGKAAQNLI